MIRVVYRALLLLHPRTFRRQFADEMLCIFDEMRSKHAAALLVTDALISLARQWLLRSGAWRLAAAGAGGLIQVTLVGFGFMLVRPMHAVSCSALDLCGERLDLTRFIYLAAGIAAGVICSVISLTLWLRNFIGRRT